MEPELHLDLPEGHGSSNEDGMVRLAPFVPLGYVQEIALKKSGLLTEPQHQARAQGLHPCLDLTNGHDPTSSKGPPHHEHEKLGTPTFPRTRT
jgi:hypothetical protein